MGDGRLETGDRRQDTRDRRRETGDVRRQTRVERQLTTHWRRLTRRECRPAARVEMSQTQSTVQRPDRWDDGQCDEPNVVVYRAERRDAEHAGPLDGAPVAVPRSGLADSRRRRRAARRRAVRIIDRKRSRSKCKSESRKTYRVIAYPRPVTPFLNLNTV